MLLNALLDHHHKKVLRRFKLKLSVFSAASAHAAHWASSLAAQAGAAQYAAQAGAAVGAAASASAASASATATAMMNSAWNQYSLAAYQGLQREGVSFGKNSEM